MHVPRQPLLPVAISSAASALIGAPWWLAAAGLVYLGLSLITAAIQAVFPQESADRLTWWRDRREHQRLRREADAREKTRTRR